MSSWGFVGAFSLVLAAWVVANSVFWLFGSDGRHGFDPYPYILLNLFLSMLAAIQGTVHSRILRHLATATDDAAASTEPSTPPPPDPD